MRKNIKCIVCIITIVLICMLSSCSGNPDGLIEGQGNKMDYQERYMTVGFKEMIISNPIDEKYGKIELLEYNGSHKEYCDTVQLYTQCWEKELENAIQILQVSLKQQDAECVKRTHELWKEYYQEKKKIQDSIYIECNYEPIGQDYRMAVLYDNALEVRGKALEMIEYAFTVNRNYTFLEVEE